MLAASRKYGAALEIVNVNFRLGAIGLEGKLLKASMLETRSVRSVSVSSLAMVEVVRQNWTAC